MDDDYYYYDEDYAEDEGEAWETALENAYATAKSLMDSAPDKCIEGMRGVERDDPVGGQWTFKAVKVLVKACRRAKAYDDMLGYYNRVAAFSHKEVSKGDVQKAMTKLMDDLQRGPTEYYKRVLETTIEAASKDMSSLGKLWFNAKHKYLTLLMEENNLDRVLEEIKPVLDWCEEGTQASLKSGQLFLSYALLLMVYTKKNDYARMRETFFMAISIVNTVPPSRVVASVMECGGKMYIHLRDWTAAHQVFSMAFAQYNESGDPRKIGCLKYLVLTHMLGGSAIDPFATHETKVYEEHPEIVPVATLLRPFAAKDVKGFIGAMTFHRNALEADPVVQSCLGMALENLRLQTLIAYVEPYERIYIRRLEEVLLVDAAEVERLCVRAVAEGKLHALLDDKDNAIVMQREKLRKPEADELDALNHLSTTLLKLNEDIRREVERIV